MLRGSIFSVCLELYRGVFLVPILQRTAPYMLRVSTLLGSSSTAFLNHLLGLIEMTRIEERHRITLHDFRLRRIRFDSFLHGCKHLLVVHVGMAGRAFCLGLRLASEEEATARP